MSQALSYFVSQARLEKSKASHTTAYKLQANAMQCMHYAICVFKEQRSTIVGDRVREGHNKIAFDKLVAQLCGQTISCNIYIIIVQIREVVQKMETIIRKRTLAISFAPRAT